jgi:hypothetical protein
VPLSAGLRNVDLTFDWKLCSQPIVRTGTWVIAISTLKCGQCKGEQRLGYSDKIKLFARYAHLTA